MRRCIRAIHFAAIAPFIVALGGCGSPIETGPGGWTAYARSGNGQVGIIGSPLPYELVVAVEDDGGRPVEGTAVDWTAELNGEITSAQTSTDATGRARAQFVLGRDPGPAIARALIANREIVRFHFEAQLPPPPPELPYDEIMPIELAT